MNGRMNRTRTTRRQFIRMTATAAAAVAAGFSQRLRGAENSNAAVPSGKIAAKADAMILIWLPGGLPQNDTWDPKNFTPFRAGMKGNELLGTCESISTAADGIRFGRGLENLAGVMDKGTVVRSLANETKFGAIHLKAQYYMMTGYLFPAGVKAPSIGSVIARTLGRRSPDVPPYFYLGRDVATNDDEKLFISDYIGPGFYGVQHAPLMVPDPGRGLAALEGSGNMTVARLDRRQEYLRSLAGLAPTELQTAKKAREYLKIIDDARALMDSPVKKAFDFRRDEKPEILRAYQPQTSASEQIEPDYYYGDRFGHGLLLARRLVECGTRFVQVEYPYAAFKGFDTHDNGRRRMIEMKKLIDRPIAQLIRDLDERGMLERTLVCVMTEFGRTIASAPAAGKEAEGFAERHNGSQLTIENERMYGFHGHFSSCNSLLFFGGGFKKGFVYGKTAPEHPMVPVENPVRLEDIHATIYRAMGIAPDTAYVTEERPFYVTKDGKGQAIGALLA